jgi:hypothetical protein
MSNSRQATTLVRRISHLARDFFARSVGAKWATIAALLCAWAVVAPLPVAVAIEPGTPVPVAAGVPGNGRAWELVTPADPVSAQIAVLRAVGAGGSELAYITLGSLPNAPSGWPLFSANLARRTADGWTTTPIPYPDPESESPVLPPEGPVAFGPSLGELIWSSTIPPRQPGWGIFRGDIEGNNELLSPTGPETPRPFRGASRDLSHVLFASSSHLVPGDAGRTEGESLYEAVGSTVRLVDVDSSGAVLSNCGSTVPQRNPISRDGRRIFFLTSPSCSGPTRAYMREDGGTTRLISACTLADCGPEADVAIAGATPSGSSAFLVTTEKLTGEDDDELADLYRYDAADGGLTLLSAIPGEVAVDAGLPVVTTPDGSRVLFWTGQGLYMGTAAGLRLIAPSASSFAEVSADGRFVVFVTSAPLVAADGDTANDVYRYDAASDASTLISTSPSAGGGEFDTWIDDLHHGYQVASHPYRAMSEDGDHIFFNTSERLLAQDHNDAIDAYGWHDGNLYLASAGSGDRPTFYVGATPDGSTAFLRTTLTLLPGDRDGGDSDIYAARVGGGFPEPSAAAACEEESCLPPLGVAGVRKAPGSGVAGGAIRVRLPRAEILRRNAARGWIRLRVEVPAGGRLTGRARAADGSRSIAHFSRRLAEARVLDLRMRLSAAARRTLAHGGQLRVRLVLRLYPAEIARTVSFKLGSGR